LPFAATLLAVNAAFAGGHSQLQPPPSGAELTSEIKVIHAGQLLARADASVRQKQTIVIRAGSIEQVVDGFIDPQQFADGGAVPALIDLAEYFVLPGLMDAHVHLMAQPSTFIRNARSRGGPISKSDLALNASVYAQRTLAAGFTTVRDVGSNNESMFAFRDAVNQGLIAGPTILVAGPVLSATGAHGDRGFDASESLDPDVRRAEGVCDGATECVQAVRHNILLGSDLIKFTATGGFMSATGTQLQYTAEEIRAIIATAHGRGLKVAAHAYAADAARLAIEAGVDSIEHGWMLDETTLREMRRQGTYLVPTLLISRPSAWSNMAGTDKGSADRDRFMSFEKAYAMGVNIAFGTDAGIYDHGQNALEFDVMTELGMSNQDAIAAATLATAELFGISDQAGSIEAGKRADIIAVPADPLADISALQNVDFVMKTGAVVKQGGRYVGGIALRPVGKAVQF
jgi:imidazolonepropionase-like amidohydrolase